VQGLVQGEELIIRVGGRRVGQLDPAMFTAPLLPGLAAGRVGPGGAPWPRRPPAGRGPGRSEAVRVASRPPPGSPLPPRPGPEASAPASRGPVAAQPTGAARYSPAGAPPRSPAGPPGRGPPECASLRLRDG